MIALPAYINDVARADLVCMCRSAVGRGIVPEAHRGGIRSARAFRQLTTGRVLFNDTCGRKDPFFGPNRLQAYRQGNIVGGRPGGLSGIASDGTLLGTIETGQPTFNVAWGEDGQTLASRAGYRFIAFA